MEHALADAKAGLERKPRGMFQPVLMLLEGYGVPPARGLSEECADSEALFFE
jgi:hypothetical protein